VRGHDTRGPQSGNRAEARGDDGHFRQVVDDDVPARVRGDVRALEALVRLDAPAAARSFDQTDDRQAKLVRHLFGVDLLEMDGRVGGAASNREVVAAHHDAPAVDRPRAGDDVGRREVDELIAFVGREPGQGADLVERAGIEQPLEAFANGESSLIVLPLDAFFAAHPARELLATADLFEFRFPGHEPSLIQPR
jgi:hypothetical protein